MSTTETAVVTGASHGIGAGLVTRFLEKGYNVVGNSRAISDSTNLTPSPQLALVDGDIGDSATAQKITGMFEVLLEDDRFTFPHHAALTRPASRLFRFNPIRLPSIL